MNLECPEPKILVIAEIMGLNEITQEKNFEREEGRKQTVRATKGRGGGPAIPLPEQVRLSATR